VIHLYAIADALVPEPPPGIDGAPVEQLGFGGLVAVVSRHQGGLARTTEMALAHAQVVADICAAGSALPVRFGSGYADAEQLRDAVAESEPRFRALLERVAGCVELGLRARTPPSASADRVGADDGGTEGEGAAAPEEGSPEGAAQGSGRAYLERRLTEQRAREAELVRSRQRIEQAAALMPPTREAVMRMGRQGPEMVFLVVRADVDGFARAAGQIAEEQQLVLTGPWPPYSFVEDAGDG
jgi:hypothetical protein